MRILISILIFWTLIVSKVSAINSIYVNDLLKYGKKQIIKPITVDTPIFAKTLFKYDYSCSPFKYSNDIYGSICVKTDNITEWYDNQSVVTTICVKSEPVYEGYEVTSGIQCNMTNLEEEKNLYNYAYNNNCLFLTFSDLYYSGKYLDNFINSPVDISNDSGEFVPTILGFSVNSSSFDALTEKLFNAVCSYQKYSADGSLSYEETYNCSKTIQEKESFYNNYALGLFCPNEDNYYAIGGTYNFNVNDFNILNFKTASKNTDVNGKPFNSAFLMIIDENKNSYGKPYQLVNNYTTVPRFPVVIDRYWNCINVENVGDCSGKVSNSAERRIRFNGPLFEFMPVIPFWGYDENKTPHSTIGYAPAKAVNMDIVYPENSEVLTSKWLDILDEYGNSFTSNADTVQPSTSVWEVRPFLYLAKTTDKKIYKYKPLEATYKLTIDHGGFESWETNYYEDNNTYEEKKILAKQYTVYGNKVSGFGSYIGTYDDTHKAPEIYYGIGPKILSGGYEGIAHITAEIISCPDAPEMVGKKASFAIKMTSKVLIINADKDDIMPDGKSEINITIALKDLKKGPIEGKKINLVINQGKLEFGSFITNSSGEIKGKLILTPETFSGEKEINLKAIAFFDNVTIQKEKSFKVGKSLILKINRSDKSGSEVVFSGNTLNLITELGDSEGSVYSSVSCPLIVNVSGPADFNGDNNLQVSSGESFQLKISDNASTGDIITITATVADNSSTPEICYNDNGAPLAASINFYVSDIYLNVNEPENNVNMDSNFAELDASVSTVSGGELPEDLKVAVEAHYSNKNYAGFGKYLPDDSNETFQLNLVPDENLQNKLYHIKGENNEDFKMPIKNLYNKFKIIVKDSSNIIRAQYEINIKSDFYLNLAMALKNLSEIQKNALKYGYNLPDIVNISKALKILKTNFQETDKGKQYTATVKKVKYALFLFNTTLKLMEVNLGGDNEDEEITIFNALLKDTNDFLTFSDIFSWLSLKKGNEDLINNIKVEEYVSKEIGAPLKSKIVANIQKEVEKNLENIAINTDKFKEYLKIKGSGNISLYKEFVKEHLEKGNIKNLDTLKEKLYILEGVKKDKFINMEGSASGIFYNNVKNLKFIKDYDMVMNTNPYLKNLMKSVYVDTIFKNLNNFLVDVAHSIMYPDDSTDLSLLKENAKNAYKKINEESVKLLSTFWKFHYGLKTLSNSLIEAGGATSLFGAYGKTVGEIELITGLTLKYGGTILCYVNLINEINYMLNTLLKKGITSILKGNVKFNPNDPPETINYNLIPLYNNLKTAIESSDYNEILSKVITLYKEFQSLYNVEKILINKADYLSVYPRGSSEYIGDFAQNYVEDWLKANYYRKMLMDNLDNYILTGESSYLEEVKSIFDNVINSQNKLEISSANFTDILKNAYFDYLIMVSKIENNLFETGKLDTLNIDLENIGEKTGENLKAELYILNSKGENITIDNEKIFSIGAHNSITLNFDISLPEAGLYNALLVILDNNSVKTVYPFDVTGFSPPAVLNANNGTGEISIDGNTELSIGTTNKIILNYISFDNIPFARKLNVNLTPLKSFYIQTNSDNFSFIRLKIKNEKPDNYSVAYYDENSNQWQFLNFTFDNKTGEIFANLPESTGYYTILYKFDEIKGVSALFNDNNSCVYFSWIPPDNNSIDISISKDNGDSFEKIAENIKDFNYSYCNDNIDLSKALFKFQINFDNGTKSKGIIMGAEADNETINKHPFLYADNVSGNVPLNVSFKCIVEKKNDNETLQYNWDINGDGKTDFVTDKNEITYSYNSSGTYKALVKVVFSNGEKIVSNEVTISVYGISNGKILSILKGWNLKSLPVWKDNNVETAELFNMPSIKTLWKWSENSWKIWSGNENIINLLTQYKIPFADKIKSGEGFWINADENVSVNIGTGEEYGIDKITLISGWNLVGIGKNITDLDFDNFGNIKTIWKWTGNSWEIWSPDSNIVNLLNKYKIPVIDEIEAGEGFWVNKQ